MNNDKIERINYLARKSKKEGLTEEERLEQQELRKEYLADFKRNLATTLDQVVLVDAEGNRRKLNQKGSTNLPQ